MAGLGLVAEHTKALVAYALVLGSPLTHSCMIVFIRSSENVSSVLHCEITSSDTRCSFYKPVVLVTLGGCHLLDGLVACGSVEACKKIVRCSEEEIVRGTMLTLRGLRRAILLERDAKGDKWSSQVKC